MNKIIEILNSNFFVALVGFLAIYIYFKQKGDKKREAARLILQEIRYAEQQIGNSERGLRGYSLTSKLLPTNNWSNNIHLFLRNLEQSEIDLISKFYSKAEYIDILIGKISDFKNLPKNPPKILPKTKPVPAASKQELVIVGFDLMQDTQSILRETSINIQFIYNTPAGEKLKKIVNKQWYRFGL